MHPPTRDLLGERKEALLWSKRNRCKEDTQELLMQYAV